MKIIKVETNYKRNLFLSKYNYIKATKYSEKLENDIINIYPDVTFQTFLGFGGTFTESSGFCFNQIPEEKKSRFIDDYFSDLGLNYSFGRLTIGSSDFSLDSYSYSNKKDLSDFSIEQDKNYILPLIKSAINIKSNINFLASPWSPPAFMKSNKSLISGR